MQQTDKFRWKSRAFSGSWMNEQDHPVVVLSHSPSGNFRARADNRFLIVFVADDHPRYLNAVTLEFEHDIEWLTLDADGYDRHGAEAHERLQTRVSHGLPKVMLQADALSQGLIHTYSADRAERYRGQGFGYHPGTQPQSGGFGQPRSNSLWDRNRPKDLPPWADRPPGFRSREDDLPRWARAQSAQGTFGRDFGQEQLNVIPTCQCGAKKGPAFVGMTCSNCQTKVLAVKDDVITLTGLPGSPLPGWQGRPAEAVKLKMVGDAPGTGADAELAYTLAVTSFLGSQEEPAPVPVSFEQLRGWYTDERWNKVTKELTPYVVARLREQFPHLVNSEALDLTDVMFQDMSGTDSRSEGLFMKMAEVGLQTHNANDFSKVSETQLAMGRVLIAGHIQTPWERGELIQWVLP